MQQPRGDIFAGSGFTEDQNRRRRPDRIFREAGQTGNLGADLGDGIAVTQHLRAFQGMAIALARKMELIF